MSSNYETPNFYMGAYGICRDPAGRLLLVRMSGGPDDGRWTMPGGGIEWGEHPDAALLRELGEETGIVDIKSFTVIQVYSHIYPSSEISPLEPLHHLGIVYEVGVGTFDLKFEKNGSTEYCEWLTKDKARSLPLTPAGEFAVDLVWPTVQINI